MNVQVGVGNQSPVTHDGGFAKEVGMRRFLALCSVILLLGCDPEGDVLSGALVARFALDEGMGTVAEDSSSYQNHGMFCRHADSSGGCVDGDGPTWGAGHSGQALLFDGVDDGVSVPFDDSLQVSQITLEAWVYWKGDNGVQQRILDRARPATSATQSDYSLSLTSSGKPMVELRLGAFPEDIKTLTSEVAVKPDLWTHVVATYDGAEIVVYVDGLVGAQVDATGPLAYLAADKAQPLGLALGNQFERNRPLKGLLDEVRIYDRGLTAGEVRSRHAGTLGP